MAEVMTYDSLLEDVEDYAERHDANFVNRIPRLVMLAEDKLARDVKNLGMRRAVTGYFIAANPVLLKPARWRRTISFTWGTEDTAEAERRPLLPRSFEYCRAFWPSPGTVADQPTTQVKYYADYDWDHWLLAATPDLAYPFELIYHERVQPLDAAHQTNWTTVNAPSLLLFAVLTEAQPFLKNMELTQLFMGKYAEAKAGLDGEEKGRVTGGDRTQHVQAP